MIAHPARHQPQKHAHLRHPAAGETTLYLVRHGRTASNVQRLLHGITDIPLDPYGLNQANLVAHRIAEGPPVDAILTSPLSRALTTARIIGERIGLEPIAIPELIEMDFGELEGSTIEQLLEMHPDLAERLFDLDDLDLTWPNGESRRGFDDRVLAAFLGILETYANHSVVVVAHGGVIGTLLNRIQGRSPADPAAFDVLNCSVTHVHVSRDATTLHLRNDVVHLENLVEIIEDELDDQCV